MEAGEEGGGDGEERADGGVKEADTSYVMQGNAREGVEGNATVTATALQFREGVEGAEGKGDIASGGDGGELQGVDDGAEGLTATADDVGSEVADVKADGTATSDEQFIADFQNGMHQVAQDDGDAKSDLISLFSEHDAEQDWVFQDSDGENAIVLSGNEQDGDDTVDLESSSEGEAEVDQQGDRKRKGPRGRKAVRKLLKVTDLAEETLAAQRAEEQRVQRLGVLDGC